MGQEITSIEAAHDWLSRQTSYQLRPGFDRMRYALSLLGQPQASLPSIIQLAGTNDKGSTLAYLQGLFISQGLRVGAFSSPHNLDSQISEIMITSDQVRTVLLVLVPLRRVKGLAELRPLCIR